MTEPHAEVVPKLGGDPMCKAELEVSRAVPWNGIEVLEDRLQKRCYETQDSAVSEPWC
jgi:hypothetical protein